ncbi:MAG: STAS domain-containing protein [Clostridia bacterium]|nr:STAS domain-containing protein [Clostridia bacterium]
MGDDIIIRYDENSRVVTVTPEGELDHYLAENMRNTIDAWILKNNARMVVFDMTDVGFMDSSGIGMLIGRYKLMKRRGGTVRVRGMKDEVFRLFKMSGLGQIIVNEERNEKL